MLMPSWFKMLSPLVNYRSNILKTKQLRLWQPDLILVLALSHQVQFNSNVLDKVAPVLFIQTLTLVCIFVGVITFLKSIDDNNDRTHGSEKIYRNENTCTVYSDTEPFKPV